MTHLYLLSKHEERINIITSRLPWLCTSVKSWCCSARTKMNPPGDFEVIQLDLSAFMNKSWGKQTHQPFFFSGMLSFQIHTYSYTSIYTHISLIHLNKIHLGHSNFTYSAENQSNFCWCWQRFLDGIGSYGCDNSCIPTGLKFRLCTLVFLHGSPGGDWWS